MPEKVFAYITHGNNFLVFSHPDFPEAGLQVPAGTMEVGETPETAVMREAFEETGLTNLRLQGCLGSLVCDLSAWGGDAVQTRHFFHLEQEGDTPSTWRHDETCGGTSEPSVFEFFWVSLPDGVPDLIAGHGQMLPALIARNYQKP